MPRRVIDSKERMVREIILGLILDKYKVVPHRICGRMIILRKSMRKRKR